MLANKPDAALRNIQPYAGPGAGINETIKYARERWAAVLGDRGHALQRPLEEAHILKGNSHPEDAEKAGALGADAAWCRTMAPGRSTGAAASRSIALRRVEQEAKNRRENVLLEYGCGAARCCEKARAIGAMRPMDGKASVGDWFSARFPTVRPCHRFLIDELRSRWPGFGSHRCRSPTPKSSRSASRRALHF